MGRVYVEGETGNKILELLPFRSSQIKLSDRTVDASIFRYLDRFYHWLAEELGIKQFQMIQESYTSFRLLIVTDAVDDERLLDATRKLEVLLKQCLFVEQICISIQCVPTISPNPINGKFQPFVSLVS
jgi:hypothetical protein